MPEKIQSRSSTSRKRVLKSSADWLASVPLQRQTRFLDELGPHAVQALPYLWEFWALSHQFPPQGDWRTWVILGGRGAGKTRAGAEWVRMQVEGGRPERPGRAHRVALVGETLDQAREVMVFGESGLLACSPPDRRPTWNAGRRQLLWPNGAIAQTFSASDPASLRGPQFDAAWCDELAKWPKGREAWDMLQFSLRLGDAPQQVVTTTPQNVEVLKSVMALDSTVVTKAKTDDNRANLSASFLAEVRARYGGTKLGQQELDGVLLDEVDGAYWSLDQLDAARVAELPVMDRVVVGVDPSVSSGARADACGIVVAGAVTTGPPNAWRGYIIEDATVSGVGPLGWAEAAVAALARHNGNRLIAEVNQGGDLVATMLQQVDPLLPYRAVTARVGKAARAEPVAALYEQGRVFHVGGLHELEAQMVRMTRTGYRGTGSPDRLDAMVWALTDLILDPAAAHRSPGIRTL